MNTKMQINCCGKHNKFFFNTILKCSAGDVSPLGANHRRKVNFFSLFGMKKKTFKKKKN